MVSSQGRRDQFALLRERGAGVRRVCGLLGMSRATPSYELQLPDRDAPVIAAMRELSAQYPRYGYRRIRVFLRRLGFELSWSRTHRLWRQAWLLVPRKRPRKRIAAARPRIHTPFRANMVWAYDFVFDTTATGQQVKCLTVVDEYTRECLAIDVAGSIRSKRVIEVLSRLVSVHGAPLFMRSDNGPEFVSQAIIEWIVHAGIATVLNDPDKPWQNGADESFNGKLRDECLSIEWSFKTDKRVLTPGSMYPYAGALFDYIRRAMPRNAPQSLSSEEVYAVTRNLLHLNGLVPAGAVMGAQAVTTLRMPNRDGFIVDDRPDTKATRCMSGCTPIRGGKS